MPLLVALVVLLSWPAWRLAVRVRSRDETAAPSQLGKALGDHLPLAKQIASLQLGPPGFVFSTTHTDRHVTEIADLLAPQGRLALIDDPKALDINLFKRKSISLHWESMFTRSTFNTPDIGAQGALLNEVSRLVDAGTLRPTATERLSPINAVNLKRVHALLESNKARGKIVLEHFGLTS